MIVCEILLFLYLAYLVKHVTEVAKQNLKTIILNLKIEIITAINYSHQYSHIQQLFVVYAPLCGAYK